MAADLHAILTALRTDPDTREAIRRELLTEELLELPALVAKLVKAQEWTQGRVSNLVGADYERREALRSIWSIEAAAGVPPGTLRTITVETLRPQLARAVAAGTLTPHAADAITKVNGLFAWGPDSGGVAGYVVVEASLTADHTDIDRALARAADLERVTGVTARAVVVSDEVAQDAANAIAQGRVAYARVPTRRPRRPTL